MLGEGPWYISKPNGIYLSGKSGDAVGSRSRDVQWKLHEDNDILTLSRHVKGELEFQICRLTLGNELLEPDCFKISIEPDDPMESQLESQLWRLEDIKQKSGHPGNFDARIQSVKNFDLSLVLDNGYSENPDVIAMSEKLYTGKPPGFRIWTFERAEDKILESED